VGIDKNGQMDSTCDVKVNDRDPSKELRARD